MCSHAHVNRRNHSARLSEWVLPNRHDDEENAAHRNDELDGLYYRSSPRLPVHPLALPSRFRLGETISNASDIVARQRKELLDHAPAWIHQRPEADERIAGLVVGEDLRAHLVGLLEQLLGEHLVRRPESHDSAVTFMGWFSSKDLVAGPGKAVLPCYRRSGGVAARSSRRALTADWAAAGRTRPAIFVTWVPASGVKTPATGDGARPCFEETAF